MSNQVRFYDATLTAGLWQQGHYLPPDRRHVLAQELDTGRVDYMEVALWDPVHRQVTALVTDLRARHARPSVAVPLTADAATNHQAVGAALAGPWPVLTFYIASQVPSAAWRPAVEAAHHAGREALVVFTHFYRTYRNGTAAAWDAVAHALASQATAIILGDEPGEALPWEMAILMHRAVRRFPGATLGVRSGNTNACADDNALVAVRQGARLVHGTLHGHGRGQGFTDLTHIRAALFRETGPGHDDPATLRHLWETGQTLDQWLYADVA